MKFELNTIAGKHKLTGVGHANYEDGYVLEIDGKRYIVYEDYPDEYRSTCSIQLIGDEEIYANESVIRFPEQDVEIIIGDFYNSEYCPGIDIEEFKIVNSVDKSIIFNAWTDDWNNYYPCAQFEYHPENLPANK